MKDFAFGLSVLVSMSLGLVGCGSDSSSDGGDTCPTGQVECDGVCIDEIDPVLTSIQTEVFEISCTASSCHDADLPAELLDLSTVTASETNLVDVNSSQVPASKRVAAGDSSASYLMNKLLGVDMALGTTQMPQLDPDGLCTPKIDVIREWIDAGAPVN
jgi:hypothetical protein